MQLRCFYLLMIERERESEREREREREGRDQSNLDGGERQKPIFRTDRQRRERDRWLKGDDPVQPNGNESEKQREGEEATEEVKWANLGKRMLLLLLRKKERLKRFLY